MSLVYRKYIKNNKSKGFTFLEIMVVVAIIGMLAYFIVPNLVGSVDKARVTKARLEIKTLENSLTMYRVDNGIYPSTAQGLAALLARPNDEPVPMNWSRKYIEKLPKDPWGSSYQYRHPGQYGDIDVFSYGPDGANQTDESKYIGNWDSN
jgi:general secretion pathway protein G